MPKGFQILREYSVQQTWFVVADNLEEAQDTLNDVFDQNLELEIVSDKVAVGERTYECDDLAIDPVILNDDLEVTEILPWEADPDPLLIPVPESDDDEE